MNYLVLLNAQAGELEKILSGTKSMIVKEYDPTCKVEEHVSPGDSLYFLRDNGDFSLRVKATVVRISRFSNNNEDLSQLLKEMQPKLQFTEDQYNYWVSKKQILLVEFTSANKISEIRVSELKIADLSNWFAFEDINQLTEQK